MAHAISQGRAVVKTQAPEALAQAARWSITAARQQVPVLAFIWDRFGPYHVDRLEAVARALAGRYDTLGVEIASFDDVYSWEKSRRGVGFRKITLFPDRRRLDVSKLRCFVRLLGICVRARSRVVFVCNYEDPVIFGIALC